jgi:hypothetical protein
LTLGLNPAYFEINVQRAAGDMERSNPEVETLDQTLSVKQDDVTLRGWAIGMIAVVFNSPICVIRFNMLDQSVA